ncbi:MAG TPA: PD-(D/E)XK nuclease family protein [Pyrinomonadaceae bacterium]|nr:PD-(D/E)XK nuclease family protein [Pyrinomonadaceae bacterium]
MNHRKRVAVSSNTAARLKAAAQWTESQLNSSELLIVSHSIEAATNFCLSVASERDALFGTHRLTLNGLAARLAQRTLAQAETVPATALSFNGIVARAIYLLNAENKLTYFAPVATKPGFPIAVARTLEELRMNDVRTDVLDSLPGGGKDLGEIARIVEAELYDSKIADRAKIFAAAIASVASTQNADFMRVPTLLLDVCIRTQLEFDLVSALVDISPDVLVTAPFGDERTILLAEQALNQQRDVIQVADGPLNSLNRLQSFLFEAPPPEAALDESVDLQNWPGEPRECIEIVRSIQLEAARGVPFDQMAIFLNSPGEYRSFLEEAFRRANIPVYFAHGSTAPDPSGRALLTLLACAADGLSASRFAEYLSLGQVPELGKENEVELLWEPPANDLVPVSETDESPASNPTQKSKSLPLFDEPDRQNVIEGALRAPSQWEKLLVESAVIGGKDRWERRLKGLENELKLRLEEVSPEEEAQVESIKKQLRDLTSLSQYALPLIKRLAQFPEKANWGTWLQHLRELAVNSLRQPEEVLATLAELEPMSPVGPVDLYEIQLVLGPKLRELSVQPRQRRYGCVFVGTADLARALSFQIVFVPGLAERIFPRKVVEDPILPDEQRRKSGSDTLNLRKDRLDLERLALRLAIGAARDRVYLSYPRIDVQQSRPRVPSFYALETLRAAEGVLPGLEEISARAESKTRARLGWPAPDRSEDAIDEAEYDLALLANLLTQDADEAIGSAHYLLSANEHLARALRARSRRWLRRWTPNDGLVDPDELARQSMANQQFSARSFSATALQNYANCPYRFFLSAVLRLEQRQEPAPIELIDPLTRGSLFHETQFEVLTSLKSKGLLPLQPESLDEAFELVDVSLDRLASELEDQLAPAIPRVWQDGINSIRADLREWLRRSSTSDQWVPEKFELSFGLSDRGPRNSDPASIKEPVEVIGDLKLRGSIDLVEQAANGNYRVTDHKTGKARAAKGTVVGGGKYLQPLLYALACNKLLSMRVESGRLYYCTADGGYEERVVSLNDENIQVITTVLIAVRQALADGFLPAAPEDGACAWCDFLAVCGGLEEIRTRRKPADKLVQLKVVRGLP